MRAETSKLILRYCHTMTTGGVITTFIGAFAGMDVTPLVELDVALIGLTGAAHSFYYYKAKCENLAKHGLKDKITMSGESEYGGYYGS